jgi:transposase InsO family protein
LRRRGMLVNHKRVLRIIREDNLLAVQPRAFVVTTDSDHEFEVYLNLASRMKLTGMNQLWIADITYIRLKKEFVYLAVVLDAFSRKVVRWALDRTLAARLPIVALEQALAQRQPPPGLVHHSDRGVQYACGDYAQILQQHQMIPSMSRPANPYDNASCESFMKTLKREEIYANDRTLAGSECVSARPLETDFIKRRMKMVTENVGLAQLLTAPRLEQQARGTVEGQAVLEKTKWPIKRYRFRTLCRATGLGLT